MHASINDFYNKNSIGKILNRLSSDLNTVDRVIPNKIIGMVNQVSTLAFYIVVLSAESTPYLMIFLILYSYIVYRY